MPNSRATVKDATKRMMLDTEFAHLCTKLDCDAAEKRRESFWKLHAQECLVEFKYKNNGRKPASLDMIL